MSRRFSLIQLFDVPVEELRAAGTTSRLAKNLRVEDNMVHLILETELCLLLLDEYFKTHNSGLILEAEKVLQVVLLNASEEIAPKIITYFGDIINYALVLDTLQKRYSHNSGPATRDEVRQYLKKKAKCASLLENMFEKQRLVFADFSEGMRIRQMLLCILSDLRTYKKDTQRSCLNCIVMLHNNRTILVTISKEMIDKAGMLAIPQELRDDINAIHKLLSVELLAHA